MIRRYQVVELCNRKPPCLIGLCAKFCLFLSNCCFQGWTYTIIQIYFSNRKSLQDFVYVLYNIVYVWMVYKYKCLKIRYIYYYIVFRYRVSIWFLQWNNFMSGFEEAWISYVLCAIDDSAFKLTLVSVACFQLEQFIYKTYNSIGWMLPINLICYIPNQTSPCLNKYSLILNK